MNVLIRKYVYVNYAVQAISVAVNFIYSLIIVRQLGASGYGEYAIFYNSLAFAVLLLGFNLPSIIVFFIANKRIDPGQLLFSSLFITFFTTIALVFLLFESRRLGISVHIFPGGNNRVLWIFFFAAQFFLLQAGQVLAAFLNANKIFIPLALFTLLSNVILLLFWAMITTHILRIDVPAFNLIWWISIAINSAILLYSALLLYRRRLIPSFRRGVGLSGMRIIGGFAIIVYLCNTLQFLNYKMDIWFVNYFHGEKDTGVYALALSLSQLIWILPNAISTVLLNYFQVKEKQRSMELAIHYARITVYASLLTSIVLSVAYYFALPYFYGPPFHETFKVCLVLFAGTIPFSISIIIANLNSGIGFIRINLFATLLILVMGCVLDYALIPV
jgi:O-antigen/teichoic acid export membrane protein